MDSAVKRKERNEMHPISKRAPPSFCGDLQSTKHFACLARPFRDFQS